MNYIDSRVAINLDFGARSTAEPVDASISITLPPHSVRVLKVIRSDTPAVPPSLMANLPATGNAGETLRFVARPAAETEPILEYGWDFGDGTSLTGASVEHAFTHAGTYQVRIHAIGLAGVFTRMLEQWNLHLLDILVVGDKDRARGPLEQRRARAFAFIRSAAERASLCTTFDPFASRGPIS